MSAVVKFFTKSKKKEDKENQGSLKRETLERASTRSEILTGGGGSVYSGSDRERDRQAMRALPNPYSVWTEPKKTKGPSSCPGVSLDSSSYYRRSSHHDHRPGSVYGSGTGGYRSSTRGGKGELSMIEERREHSYHHPHNTSRSHYNNSSRISQEDVYRAAVDRRNRSYIDQSYATSESEEDEEHIERQFMRLENQISKLKDDKSRLRDELNQKNNDLEYAEFQLRNANKKINQLEKQIGQMEKRVRHANKHMERAQSQLTTEREKTDSLELQLSSALASLRSVNSSSLSADGARERLVSSSETSLDMSRDDYAESENGTRTAPTTVDDAHDEVRVFRGSEGADDRSISTKRDTVEGVTRLEDDDGEEKEIPRRQTEDTCSLEFDLRRSASDTGLTSYSRPPHFPAYSGSVCIDGVPEEMAEQGDDGVERSESWKRSRRGRGSVKEHFFVKKSTASCLDTSESSEGEMLLLRERQLKKRGEVVKYDPSKRQPIKEKHYKRYSKHERSALERFGFLENENTDISGLLSSPNEGNY